MTRPDADALVAALAVRRRSRTRGRASRGYAGGEHDAEAAIEPQSACVVRGHALRRTCSSEVEGPVIVTGCLERRGAVELRNAGSRRTAGLAAPDVGGFARGSARGRRTAAARAVAVVVRAVVARARAWRCTGGDERAGDQSENDSVRHGGCDSERSSMCLEPARFQLRGLFSCWTARAQQESSRVSVAKARMFAVRHPTWVRTARRVGAMLAYCGSRDRRDADLACAPLV